jgi:acyl carrier protein
MASMDNNTSNAHLRMEALLLQDPSIKQAKIVDLAPEDVDPLSPSTPMFTAVLSLADDESEEAAAVVTRARRSLRKSLPDCKALVPKSWSLLPSLPVTTPGGTIVDSAALTRRLSSVSAAAASEPVEEKVRRIVSHCLRQPTDEVSLDASFKRLGGDSIAAIEVMARCNEEGLDIHVLDVLHADTLAHLARIAATGEHVPEVARSSAVDAGVSPSTLSAL